MVWVPAGNFVMGDAQGNGSVDELPLHEVNIAQRFAISQYEITVAEFSRFIQASGYVTEAELKNGCFMRGGKSWKRPAKDFSQEENHPVVCVSWNDANAYAKWLSDQSGFLYRLPTEAEWEYSARGGEESDYPWGNNIGKARAMCLECDGVRVETGTVPVGMFEPNHFGLYDTSGNVWEWTSSDYAFPYDGSELKASQLGVKLGRRSIRSGGWLNLPEDLRASNRGVVYPADRYSTLGIRVVREEQRK